MMKTRIFIGSSKEGLTVANYIKHKLTEAGFDKILEECQKQAKTYVEQYNK